MQHKPAQAPGCVTVCNMFACQGQGQQVSRRLTYGATLCTDYSTYCRPLFQESPMQVYSRSCYVVRCSTSCRCVLLTGRIASFSPEVIICTEASTCLAPCASTLKESSDDSRPSSSSEIRARYPYLPVGHQWPPNFCRSSCDPCHQAVHRIFIFCEFRIERLPTFRLLLTKEASRVTVDPNLIIRVLLKTQQKPGQPGASSMFSD